MPPTRKNRTGRLSAALKADQVYRRVRGYSAALGFEIGAHALRATAATNLLNHQADIAKVQEWLGHANIDAHLRSPAHAARGQTNVQGCVLMWFNKFTSGPNIFVLQRVR